MLKSIDVLIGLTLIMAVLSMAVTVITQFVTTAVNSRGRHLRRGLVDLLAQIDPGLRGTVGERLATAVLQHPLVSASANRLGSVVHREEFTKLLLSLADASPKPLEQNAGVALKKALVANGIADPAGALKAIRSAALALEQLNPDVAAAVRSNLAILQATKSDFIGKVNGWFDQTMDRVAQRFTASTRAITFAAAFVVAVGLQVDTILLVNRLSADEKLREAFVATALAIDKSNTAPKPAATPDPTTSATPAASASTAAPAPAASPAASTKGATPTAVAEAAKAPPSSEKGERSASIDREYLAFLADNGLITLPTSGHWRERWKRVSLVGVVITSLLLSLGAPFWYNALSRLLQLRSTLAVKDDEQRAERQGAGASARA